MLPGAAAPLTVSGADPGESPMRATAPRNPRRREIEAQGRGVSRRLTIRPWRLAPDRPRPDAMATAHPTRMPRNGATGRRHPRAPGIRRVLPGGYPEQGRGGGLVQDGGWKELL